MEWKRRGAIAGIIAGVYVVFRFFLPAAFPFLAAWMLAELVYPAAQKAEKRTKLKKTTAGALILTLLFAAAGVLLYLGVREILEQIKTAVSHIPMFKRYGNMLLDNCCGFLEEMTGIAASESRNYFLTHAETLWENILSGLSPGTALTVFSWIKRILVWCSGVVIAYISSILILGDMEMIRRKIREFSWMMGFRRVIRRLKETTVTYLKAQLIIVALVSAVCAAGLWMMKNPYFLILGITLGILDMLPLIGTGTFLYPAAVICLLQGKGLAAIGCVLLDVVTSLLREFLEPRLLGKKLGVSPIMILISVYAGILLFGGWGVLLGPLAFSTVYETGREWDVWD